MDAFEQNLRIERHMEATLQQNAERRKSVRLRLRSDLVVTRQKYEGKTCHVVKDPISLRYYRFNEREYYVLTLLDGKHTMDEVQKKFESNFRPDRLTLEDLEGFARQLVTSGLVQHESPNAAKHLFQQQQKQRNLKRMATLSNILYLKIPVFDPDRILNQMIKYTRWIFTTWFLAISVAFMLAAVALVTMHFQVFWDKLPTYNEFFQFHTLLYMWLALGVVKVIHEFGHGLSCKAFGGECHEMGALLLCFSPALYCNVTDSWTVADKWKRIIISFAGIYVELIIAAAATFVWWFTPHMPYINNIALCLMTLCSVSTFVFNANPLMRFDGYYIMADWLEIPNLRDRANRYLGNLTKEYCLGIETQPEPYMKPSRRVLFLAYAIVSYIYRWVVTFSILYFLSGWLKPYKLETLSLMLTALAFGSMVFWPMFRLRKSINQRGRLPDMKMQRVAISGLVLAGVIGIFAFVPLPVSRIMETGLVQMKDSNVSKVFLPEPGFLTTLYVRDGEWVAGDQLIAEFKNPKLEADLAELTAKAQIHAGEVQSIRTAMSGLTPDQLTRGGVDWKSDLLTAEGNLRKYQAQTDKLKEQLQRGTTIKAPQAGYVMTPPRREEVGKYWDKQSEAPFCSVGNPEKVRVVVPVAAVDYRLLKDDLAKYGELEVSIFVPGRMDKTFRGRVVKLPETDAKNVPIQLTHRGGGSLAVKQNADPKILAPLAQHYLVTVELLDADATVHPGVLAHVKIHCEWRSAAWWTWRGIASALDIGLI